MRTLHAVLITLLALAVDDCANAIEGASAPEDARREGRELHKPLPERVPAQSQGVTGEVPDSASDSVSDRVSDRVSDKVMQRVLAALRAELGAAPRDVEILVAQEVVWPSGALGCGKPGQNYQPVPVAGQRVVLRAGGNTYDYRVAGAQILLCGSLPRALKDAVIR